jgi:hypothetical protein
MISILKKNLTRILFYKDFRKLISFFKNSDLTIEHSNENKASYIILLAPWALNRTSWFSIAVGLLLYKRGHKINFLIDDLRFEKGIDRLLQISLIKKALKKLNRIEFNTFLLSDYKTNLPLNESEILTIEKLAFANTVHINRGEEQSEAFKKSVNSNVELLSKNFPAVKSFISTHTEDRFIVAGGIYANTGLFETFLRQNDRDYFTYDSGFSVLLSTYNGVSAQFKDIPLAFDMMMKVGQDHKNFAISFAEDECEKRKKGTNKLNSQYQSYEDSDNFDQVGILIPLNSPWDSAALNIASLFSSYNEWLLETVGLILAHSNYYITIRQHPDERFWWGRTKTDFKKLIEEKYNDKRIQFVSCWDKVNSYALLEKSDAVVCYSSTFGIEAIMSGKSLCVCSNVYYSDLGFAFKPKNTQEMISFLQNEKGNITKEAKESAAITYYLGQHCNWLFTPFTPMGTDFDSWLKIGLADLYNDPSVKIYLESLEKLIPISFVNHMATYEKQMSNIEAQISN